MARNDTLATIYQRFIRIVITSSTDSIVKCIYIHVCLRVYVTGKFGQRKRSEIRVGVDIESVAWNLR